MLKCKNCHSVDVIRNGVIRKKQRYLCRACGLNFVEGDERIKGETEAKKLVFRLLKALGDVPLQRISRFLDVWPSQLSRWASRKGSEQVLPVSMGKRNEEMCLSDVSGAGDVSAENLCVVSGELWPGCKITIVLEKSSDAK